LTMHCTFELTRHLLLDMRETQTDGAATAQPWTGAIARITVYGLHIEKHL